MGTQRRLVTTPWVGGTRSLIGGMCALALFSSGALAQTATVQPVVGDLSLNRGRGFERVARPVQVNEGDSLMVGRGGSAILVYADGCQVNIQPGSVVNVAPFSPCASGTQRATPHPPSTYYAAAGAPVPDQPPYTPPDQQAGGSGFGTLALVGTGLVVLGIGAGVYVLTRTKSPAPASQ